MSELRGRISIGQAATILANIGVLVGLVFVILELQQNRVSLEAEIELSLAQSYQEAMGRSLENPAVAELLSTAFTDPESLTQIQYVQLMAWNAEWMAIVYATYRLRISGAVDEDSWRQHANYFPPVLEGCERRSVSAGLPRRAGGDNADGRRCF